MAKTYRVDFDQKVEIWSRETFYIDAENKKEALEKAKEKQIVDGPDQFEYLVDSEIIIEPSKKEPITCEWRIDDKVIETNKHKKKINQ